MQLAPGVGSAPSAATCTRATSRRRPAPSGAPAARTSRKRRRKGASTSPSGPAIGPLRGEVRPRRRTSRRPAKSASSPMRTLKRFPDWDTILFRGAQLARMPLNEDVAVTTETVIGRTAAKPLDDQRALLRLAHVVRRPLPRGEDRPRQGHGAGSAPLMCSGEGGMLPEERERREDVRLRAGHGDVLPRGRGDPPGRRRRDQDRPGREAGPRRPPAGGEGDRGDRADPRNRPGRSVDLSRPLHGAREPEDLAPRGRAGARRARRAGRSA